MSRSAHLASSACTTIGVLAIVALALANGCKKPDDAPPTTTANAPAPRPVVSDTDAERRLGFTEGSFVDGRDGQTYRFTTYDPVYSVEKVELELGRTIDGDSRIQSEPNRHLRRPPQTWMVDNLNYSGDDGNGHRAYLLGSCFGVVADSVSPHRDSSTCGSGVGRRYDWATAMAVAESTWIANRTSAAKNCSTFTCQNGIGPVHRGICPAGWHLPSVEEWDLLLENFQRETLFQKFNVTPDNCGECDPAPRVPVYSLMKAIVKEYPDWNHETDARNPFHFSLEPLSKDRGIDFWSRSELPYSGRDTAEQRRSPANPYAYAIQYDNRAFYQNPVTYRMTDQASIRCVKDVDQIPSTDRQQGSDAGALPAASPRK